MELKTDKKIRVVPDLHGNDTLLNMVLSEWNKESELLIFLGDLIDRGQNSLAIVRKVKELVESGYAYCIRGNHELMFNWYIKSDGSNVNYLRPYVGGMDFIDNFIDDLKLKGYDEKQLENASDLLPIIRKEYKDIITFLKDLPLYINTEHILFTHAAVTYHAEEIYQMKENDFIWGYEGFEGVEPMFRKTIIVGHTPTFRINEDESSDIYFGPNNQTVFIDGGPFMKQPTTSFHHVLIEEQENTLELTDREVFLYTKEPFIKTNHFTIDKINK